VRLSVDLFLNLQIGFPNHTSEMSYDLIIVGAGIAGLRTGLETLRQHPQIRCTILEKYKYNGGRVTTFHKDLPKVGHIQWENGAGRIADSHTKVIALLKKYGLHMAPISPESNYLHAGSTHPNTFTQLHDIYIEPLRSLSKETLQSHTLVELWNKVLGEKKAREFYSMFPYHSELHTLRADHGIYVFDYEMGRSTGFSVCIEGLSSLISHMVADFLSLGGSIQHEQEVTEICCVENKMHLKTRDGSFYESNTCVMALHANAMRGIKGVSTLPILNKLIMTPLLRMYAVFPLHKGKAWFSDLPRTITDDPIRHIIPMGGGSIMISYTDGDDAKYWMNQKEVPDKVMKRIRDLFPQLSIPDPLFFKMHPWLEGCTYWKPGQYDIFEESKKSLQPLPKEMPGLFLCGESFAVLQCWMECAITQADHMMELHTFQQRFK